MRTVRVNTNGPATEGLAAKLNCHMRDEQIDVRDGVAGDGQGLSEEGESRINEDAEDVNRGRLELVQVLEARAASQQQPQGPVVHWERFLPVRSLKVLLVENDDSTRHVVSALLRNCSYEVTAAANGLEAWKILEELPNHIDLVLTEVVMPYLSGIGLLSKIMNHKTCKNIPVIMMSSNDSMGIVFKCLSKGAVDFLVKPIRKNELKNLWQHVWRKCHSSSGSGSESGIRAQKSSKSKSVEGSANNTGSNDEDDIGSIGLNARDGSDNGSGTQNSWSKRSAEVESPQPMSPWDQTADPPDNTFALVIHSTPEAFSNNWVPTTAIRGCPEEDDEFDNFAMGKDLKIGVLRNSDLELENPNTRVSNGRTLDLDLKKGEKKFEKGKLELRPETPNGKLGNDAADLIAIITNNSNPQAESIPIEYPNEHSKIFHTKDMAQYDTKELPSLELSLKRLKQVGDSGTRSQERNVLRHSDLSAFSRYNTSTGNQAPTGNVGSCSPFDNSSEAAKTESMCNLHSNSKGTPKQRSNGSSNNNDMGSTTNNVVAKPEAFTNEPMPKTAVNVHPYVTFQPVQHSNSSVQPLAVDKADAAMVNSVLEQAKAKHPNVQVQHHHHHYHHHHHHVHNMQQQLPSHDDMSLRNMAAEAPHYGSSNALSVPNEGIATNYVSASGSNNGSNGQNDSGDAVIAEGENLASDYGVDGNDGLGLENGCGSRGGADQNRFAQREAALNKFRQKRKERCFEKKVRYQSRKKLAEQRPRVRGQFVRQTANENVSRDTNC